MQGQEQGPGWHSFSFPCTLCGILGTLGHEDCCSHHLCYVGFRSAKRGMDYMDHISAETMERDNSIGQTVPHMDRASASMAQVPPLVRIG